MSKTHLEILIATEEKLFEAMISFNLKNLSALLHPNIIYINEIGEVTEGFHNLKINNPDILRIKNIDVKERKISFFNNVAIVNTVEVRTGEYFGINFHASYRLTRTWKFTGSKWILIATSIIVF